MFSTLHDLAKRATLMITVAAEGDDQLRVNVTPMPADTKAKSNLPQPLSLLATPTEFDAEFIAALSTWQAPKRSLIQQAQDAAGAAVAPPALPAPKPEAKPDAKGEKPARKQRAGKGGDEDKKGDAVPGAAAAAGEAVAEVDQVMAATAGASVDEQPSAGGPDAVTNAAPGSAVEGASEQMPQSNASTEGDGAPNAPAGDEPVDKFTLDLF